VDNKVLETIKARRSIRAYQKKQLNKEQINALVEAALASPSAMNLQPWHFIVVQNQSIVNELGQGVVAYFKNIGDENIIQRLESRNNKVFYDAPCVIVISAKPEGMYQIDVGIAAQNIAVAAKSMGLDSVILGLPRVVFEGEIAENWKNKLQFPEGHEYGLAVAVGYAAMEKEPHERDHSKVTFIK
jgi:nitroreductase